MVCEPVLVETAFFLARSPAAQDSLLSLLNNETLKIAFNSGDYISEVRTLCKKYCLDSRFTVYRKYGKERLKPVYPEVTV